jgi:hypothetical protein
MGGAGQKAVRTIVVAFGPEFVSAYPTEDLQLSAFKGLFQGDFAQRLPALIEYEVSINPPI